MTGFRWAALSIGALLWSTAAGAAGEPASPYAVCAHLSRGGEHEVAREELRLMRQAGIGWVRTDFDWSGVERRPGQWTFDHLDETVAWAEQEKIRILPILDYDVPWARPAYQHLDQWLEYVRRVVTRYKDRLRHWEVWNEPNLEGFWRDKPSPENYVKLLEATYREIKRIDPELVVLLGGTAGIPWSYLKGVYQAGGREFFDVMNVHPYRYPAAPEERSLSDDLARLRKLMAAHGDADKPIWITEIGWPTHEGPRGVTPAVQAEMLTRTFLLALQSGVDVVFWYEFQAPERKPDYNEDHFGIVHRDLSPKPAYVALKTLAHARPAGSKILAGPWQSGQVYHPGWQRPDGRNVWALWRVGDEKKQALRVEGAPLEVLDSLDGTPIHVKTEGNRVELVVSEKPVYVVGPTGLEVR
jgi:hypothetical protein